MAKRKQTGRQGPGRPPVHGEPYTRVNVILFNRQIAWLDHLSADIRGQTGAAIHRAELIRGILDAIAAGGVNLTAATSEQEVRDIISRKISQSK